MLGQLQVPYRADIANLFPEAQSTSDGNLLLQHNIANTTILRRLGYKVAAPVLSNYKFTGTREPFKVQRITVEMLTMNKRAYVLSGMGVGKTACPLWALDYLRQEKLANRMLVSCPLSTMDFVWMAELLKIASPLKGVVVFGDRKKRHKLLDSDADVYIINHDGVEVVYEALMERKDINVLTIDELATFRNKSERTKLMEGLAHRMEWAWGMTGSPTPQAPTDVWNQARILTPNTVPRWFGSFREKLMLKIPHTFKWVPKKDAAEQAYEALQPSVRFTLDDVSELPPFISRRIDVPLGVKQAKVYEEIRKDCLSLMNGEVISAVNKGVMLNKLLQISLGYVYTKTKGIVSLDNDARIKAMVDIIDACSDQLIVFAPFKHALDGIMGAVRKAKYTVAKVDGDVPYKERAQIFNDFQNNGRYKVLAAHPQCLAHGLTLTAASTVIWFGPIASLEIYDQANARIRRTGQTKKQQFIHLQATKAEKDMYSILIGKQDMQGQILRLFEDDMQILT